MIRFVCGTCKEKLALPDRHAGREGTCPMCGSINLVPGEGDLDVPPPILESAGTAGSEAVNLDPGENQPQSFPVDEPSDIAVALVPQERSLGLLERLLAKVVRKPPAGSELDVYDAGGIPRSVKVLFVVGILVLVPLSIGAAIMVMILLRVKLGS
jgi:hypothetical protein